MVARVIGAAVVKKEQNIPDNESNGNCTPTDRDTAALGPQAGRCARREPGVRNSGKKFDWTTQGPKDDFRRLIQPIVIEPYTTGQYRDAAVAFERDHLTRREIVGAHHADSEMCSGYGQSSERPSGMQPSDLGTSGNRHFRIIHDG
jgi:hypothetical protein